MEQELATQLPNSVSLLSTSTIILSLPRVPPLTDSTGMVRLFSHKSRQGKDAAPSSNIHEKESSKKVDEILSALTGATALTLGVLRDAAALAPIPYLSQAASLALTIFDAIDACSSNKEDFKRLAEDSCSLVYAVASTCDELTKDGTEISSQLQMNLQQLCITLAEVNTFAQKRARRHLFVRFMGSKNDLGKILSFRQQMRQGLDVFTLQANITVQQIVSRIAAQQNVEQAPDGETKSSPSPENKADSPEATQPTSSPTTPSSQPPRPGPTPVSQVAFPNLFAGASEVSGSMNFTNVSGNQHNVHTEDNSTSSNFNNVFNTSNSNSNNKTLNSLNANGFDAGSFDTGSFDASKFAVSDHTDRARGRGKKGRGRIPANMSSPMLEGADASKWYPGSHAAVEWSPPDTTGVSQWTALPATAQISYA